ncbi:MAG TPA: N-acetyl-gamma-glutamyl-phosphate reductase [Planctomycetota bacterium]
MTTLVTARDRATALLPVWVIGAGGALAGEFLRLLQEHPHLRLGGAATRSGGEALEALQPQLGGSVRTTTAAAAAEAIAALVDAAPAGAGPVGAVVLALPHGASAAAWLALRGALGERAERLAVVDLAADFRLANPVLYAAAYGQPHPAPEELGAFVYGLPEWNRAEVRAARRVAAPGCFATALQLAVLPAARAGLLDVAAPWVLHAITGSSGSGAKPSATAHHPHRQANLRAYALDGHRHEAELVQALGRWAGIDAAPLHFLPHSGPFVRGIHLTAALPLRAASDPAGARAVYREAYADCPFVQVLEAGVPELRHVAASNRASLAVHARGGVLTVLLALDNLLKGGAGQALQCLNLMLGMPETAGLPRAGLGMCG